MTRASLPQLDLDDYRARSWPASGLSGPTLHLDDVSAIPFLDGVSGVEHYQHRARLRAGPKDLCAAVTEPAAGQEEYFGGVLDLGTPTCLVARAPGSLLEVSRACATRPALDHLVSIARRHRRLAIHPYMGIEAVWTLASAIAEAAGAEVRVLAPPPPVTWAANDKATFDQLVRNTVGERALVETRCSADPAELTSALLKLAEEHRRVALKRLRCASAMGNLVLESQALRTAGHAAVRRTVDEFLSRTLWDGAEAVQAVAWLDSEESPSTQWWIPHPDLGPPGLDGIYDQILSGPHRVFVGSRPSLLPETVLRGLEELAAPVAKALQQLGYIGRCSFDHLVVGDPHGEHRLVFTECNGRWGGTSTPMSLLDRLLGRPSGGTSGGPRRRPYRAQDFVDARLVGCSFPELLRRVGQTRYDSSSGAGTFLFYNVGPLVEFGKIDVIALADSPEEADHAIEVELPALLGLARKP